MQIHQYGQAKAVTEFPGMLRQNLASICWSSQGV